MQSSRIDGTLRLPDQENARTRVLALAARIVSAHVAHNAVRCHELPSLIQAVCRTLTEVSASSVGLAKYGNRRPAVPINRSVFADYIICLENGRRLRTLRRHLMSAYGLTPEAYRRRWGLPHDYPMVAPGYAKVRSGVAKSTGLGRTSRPRPKPRTTRSPVSKAWPEVEDRHLTEL